MKSQALNNILSKFNINLSSEDQQSFAEEINNYKNMSIAHDYSVLKVKVSREYLSPFETVLAKELKKIHPELKLSRKQYDSYSVVTKENICLGNVYFLFGMVKYRGDSYFSSSLDGLLKLAKENNVQASLNSSNVAQLEEELASHLLALDNIKGLEINQKNMEIAEKAFLNSKEIFAWLMNEGYKTHLEISNSHRLQRITVMAAIGRKKFDNDFYHPETEDFSVETYEQNGKTYASVIINNPMSDEGLDYLKAHFKKYI